MANLLSCVDEIAQDLRDELDALAENPENVRTSGDPTFEAEFADTHATEPTSRVKAKSASQSVRWWS